MAAQRATATAVPTCGNRTGARRPPHIAFLMADDLGFADTGFAGSPLIRTPFLDTLAREAVHMTHFRAPTWCAPSRAAFLTGRHGWELGIAASQGWTVLGKDVLLLSEVLKEVGYHTAIVGKFHFNPALRRHHPSGTAGFGCGFDQQYGFVGGQMDYYAHHPSWSRDGKQLREEGYATELFAAEAERVVLAHGRLRPTQPLFLWMAPNAPHTPMQAPKAALERFGADLHPEVRLYAAMVFSMDEGYARLHAALRRAGMLSNTLTAFVSDNGGPSMPSICNGGLRGGKGTSFEGGVRVPAFVHWPRCLGRGRGGPRQTSAAGHMVDWFVTLAEAAAVGLPEAQHQKLMQRVRHKAPHSLSLWPYLADSAPLGAMEKRQLVLQVGAPCSGVLRGRWKLVMASPRCLNTSLRDVDFQQPMRGFMAHRYLLDSKRGHGGADEHVHGTHAHSAATALGVGDGDGAGHGDAPTPEARLRAARAMGVQLQLFDLHNDPAERHDQLSGRNASVRAATASALLGHYLSALRVAHRAVGQAQQEGRLAPEAVKVWFCRQVYESWAPEVWSRYHSWTCNNRRGELTKLASVRLASS